MPQAEAGAVSQPLPIEVAVTREEQPLSEDEGEAPLLPAQMEVPEARAPMRKDS